MLWVAAAGPFANLLMAIGWALMFGIALRMGDTAYRIPAMKMADAGVQINAILMFLNLIPVPPLDGGRITGQSVAEPLGDQLRQARPLGLSNSSGAAVYRHARGGARAPGGPVPLFS